MEKNLKGIDVSSWQTIIDWNKVDDLIDFAILKLGNITDSKKFELDKYFNRNYEECRRLNIPVGVYLYCYTNEITNAEKSAKQVVNYLQDKPIQLPVYIDMEDTEIAVEGKQKLTEMVIAFNTIIEKAGLWAGVYANLNWFNNYLNKVEIKNRYTTWIAHPENIDNINKYKGQYDLFQYSWKGKFKGIIGDVDMNVMYRDLLNEINEKEEKEEIQMPKNYQTLEELPDYAKSVFKKLIDNKILKGNENGLDLDQSMVRTFVILDRIGLLENLPKMTNEN